MIKAHWWIGPEHFFILLIILFSFFLSTSFSFSFRSLWLFPRTFCLKPFPFGKSLLDLNKKQKESEGKDHEDEKEEDNKEEKKKIDAGK